MQPGVPANQAEQITHAPEVLSARSDRLTLVRSAVEELGTADQAVTPTIAETQSAEVVELSPAYTQEQILSYIDMVHRRAA